MTHAVAESLCLALVIWGAAYVVYLLVVRRLRRPTRVHLVIDWEERKVEAYRASSYAGWAWEGHVSDLARQEFELYESDDARECAEKAWNIVEVEVKP